MRSDFRSAQHVETTSPRQHDGTTARKHEVTKSPTARRHEVMIVVIDYKAGNLYNVGNALKYLKAEFTVSGDPAVVSQADRVILPGVGSARAAMESLTEQGLVRFSRAFEFLSWGFAWDFNSSLRFLMRTTRPVWVFFQVRSADSTALKSRFRTSGGTRSVAWRPPHSRLRFC